MPLHEPSRQEAEWRDPFYGHPRPGMPIQLRARLEELAVVVPGKGKNWSVGQALLRIWDNRAALERLQAEPRDAGLVPDSVEHTLGRERAEKAFRGLRDLAMEQAANETDLSLQDIADFGGMSVDATIDVVAREATELQKLRQRRGHEPGLEMGF